jgi:hypothetical protein
MENKSKKSICESDFEVISNKISEEFSSIGLEHYPFKVFNIYLNHFYINSFNFQLIRS